MFAVDGVVHGADLGLGDLAGETLDGAADGGMVGEGLLAHKRHGLVRRKVVEIIGENAEVQGLDGAVGRVAGDDLDLVRGE